MSEISTISNKLVLKCPYCGGRGELKPGDSVWPGKGYPALYVCENYPACDSYVRCHAGTEIPLGTMAGKRLRRLRKVAHDQFDPIWQDEDCELGRSAAYDAAALVMGVEGEFHIGNLTEQECEEFIDRIRLVALEMDKRLSDHSQRSAPPSPLTIEVLHALFHPDRDTFEQIIGTDQIVCYEQQWIDARRCGLIVVDQTNVRLSPKGANLVYDHPSSQS